MQVAFVHALPADFARANIDAALAPPLQLALNQLPKVRHLIAGDDVGARYIADDAGQAAIFRRPLEAFDQQIEQFIMRVGLPFARLVLLHQLGAFDQRARVNLQLVRLEIRSPKSRS